MAQDFSALRPPFTRNFATSTSATEVKLPPNARKVSISGSGTLMFAYAGTDGQALASGVGYFLASSQAYEGAPADPPGGARALGGRSVFIQANSGTPTCYVAIE
tara:strand:- start:251 stop:562 length:312 start_codon:yes stop_codon:yes gene_type:complete